MSAPPTGTTIISPVHTGGTDAHAWIVRTLNALADVYRDRGASDENAWYYAIANTAQLVTEVGRGRSEYDYDAGNIACSGTPGHGWTGVCHELTDGRYYRAYANAEDFAEDYVSLITGWRYAGAWAILRDGGDPTAWYHALTVAGYHPPSVASDASFASIYPEIRRVAGPAPVSGGWVAPVVTGAVTVAILLAAHSWWRRRRR